MKIPLDLVIPVPVPGETYGTPCHERLRHPSVFPGDTGEHEWVFDHKFRRLECGKCKAYVTKAALVDSGVS